MLESMPIPIPVLVPMLRPWRHWGQTERVDRTNISVTGSFEEVGLRNVSFVCDFCEAEGEDWWGEGGALAIDAERFFVLGISSVE